MRSFHSKLIAVLVCAFALASGEARAQLAPAADAGSCRPVERELASCLRDVDAARTATTSAEDRAGQCARDLSAAAGRIKETSEATARCEQSRAHLCSATSAFAEELGRGRTQGATETGCVSPDQQARLDAFVNGTATTTAALAQIAAYESGETDSLAHTRLGATPIERALHRVLRDGERRALHRRLLVDALRVMAPLAWKRIRDGGAASIDAWFSSTAPLDSAIVSEARQTEGASPGPAGPPLTAALHLVRAFRLTANCDAATAVGECFRARQLEQLLESSGSLVVRRRVQEIWATECSSIDLGTITEWTEDFPTAHGGAAEPWREIAESAYAKLFACYLDDASEHRAFGSWLKEHLPSAADVTAARLQRVDAIRSQWAESSREAACARAVRAMQTMSTPSTCAVPAGELRPALDDWTRVATNLEDAGVPLAMCAQFALLLWEGKAPSIDGSFSRPPSLDEMVAAKPMPPTPMWRLRAHCEERRGAVGSFEGEIATLASFGRAFGEGIDEAPYRIDPKTSAPVELLRFEQSLGSERWLDHLAGGTSACSVLGLSNERCHTCATAAPSAVYDCALVARLEESWSTRTRTLFLALAALISVIIASTWARRLRHARIAFDDWARDTVAFFEGIDLACSRDRWRFLMPSRHDTVFVALPSSAAWERWGNTAVIVRAPPGRRVLERDVNHAAFVARAAGGNVAILEHDDDATLDISAVRAMLEWAAKGGTRAVQILPIGVSRARWSKSAQDVLDLVEESSLRGNPFELRGRVATSNQFFNRERLVSGLLAAAQAGHWTVVTGLRRFGKSSLVLEVARRLPGPSAYVDLAGFDHEIGGGGDSSAAASAMLRYACVRLAESARARWPRHDIPEAPPDGAKLDATELTRWLKELSRATERAAGHATPILIVLDEIEQALSASPDRLARAVDALAVLLGRLKTAVGDAAMADGGATIGVFLTSALHPVLWAPLATLGQQSIMGSFQRVCVPTLDVDAATTMMRSLGGRQGVRFAEEALSRIVAESQGVPLLLRRLGASVLELYDTDLAREGSLGAVDVGIEGANEAVEREVREGSPLRVWIETEIASRRDVPGVLLRRLANEDVVPISELHTLATSRVREEFERSGVTATLAPDELARRAEEAGHVIVQLLDESGLVVAHGDLTRPHAYSLPDGALRRVLLAQHSVGSMRRDDATP